MLYVCTADDIQCKEWLAVIPEDSLRHVDDKLCLCSLHFDGGVNVSGDATPTIFPPVPGLSTSTSEPQQQSKTHGGEQAMIGPATTIKQELVDVSARTTRTRTRAVHETTRLCALIGLNEYFLWRPFGARGGKDVRS